MAEVIGYGMSADAYHITQPAEEGEGGYRVMLNALRARDVYLVAGCAAAGSMFLAFGILISDLALAVIDPRTRE